MPNLIIGLENIWRRFFVDENGRALFSFRTFKNKYLNELYKNGIIQQCETIAGRSSFCEESIFIQWKREKFTHPKYL